jgi:transcriptional regulator with XRE-family HTH domain
VTDAEYLGKLGAQIAKKRSEAGYNQSQFALKCDMDRQNMHRIEHGTENVKILTLRKFARELDISITDLLDFK